MPNDQDNNPEGLTPMSEMPEVEREPETVGEPDSTSNFSSEPAPESSQTPVEANEPVATATPVTQDSSLPQPEATAAPFAAPVDNASQNSLQQPKKSKKKWIIGGVLAAVVVLLAGTGALAYSIYQSPDKVIADGLSNLFNPNSQSGSAVASLNYKDKDMTLTLSMNGQSDQKITTGTLGVKYTSKSNKMDVEGTADFAADMGSNGYIKLNDVDKLVDTAADAYIESMAKQYEAYGQKLTPSDLKQAKKELLASINPMVEKINNRWIKFAADDKENETSAEQKCITDVFTKLQNDNSMRNELTNIYKDNKFVTVKEELGVKDGSYGYVLELNEDKAKSFGKNVKESAFMKELKKCNSSFGESSVDSITDSSEEPAVKDARFELWVSQWSHQITGVNFSGKNPDDTDASMKFNMTFDYKPVTGLSLPKDAIDSKELEKEFESLMMGGSSSTSTSATTVSSSV